MRYLALASDYDGTLAHDGRVRESTQAALVRLRESGRKLLLVTGRELDELLGIYAGITVFDWVVAENGALLYQPATRREKLLAKPADLRVVEALRARGVERVSVGRAIIATWEPHEVTALEVIRDLGLELQVIFNKGAVMILPAGVNKATGLAAALKEMELSPHNVVGVGDAENDHAFLEICECSAAVSNALPMLQEHADLVTRADHGAGVVELIDGLLADDLSQWAGRLGRHHLLLGTAVASGEALRVPPYGSRVLLAGPAASGKSTVAAALLERLAEQKYQFCVIDPQGHYETFPLSIALGSQERPPTKEKILQLLKDPTHNVVVNLIGLPLADQPAFLQGLWPQLQAFAARTGRPHWLMLDEAHHLLPASRQPPGIVLLKELGSCLLRTVHPDQLALDSLRSVATLLVTGETPTTTVQEYCRVVAAPCPAPRPKRLEPGEVLWWEVAGAAPPQQVRILPGTAERRRHDRKCAEGELPPDRSFYFRGPQGKLQLRAQNLNLFLQIADGVDQDTWLHHLRQRDYSHWIRTAIKNDELADEVAKIEAQAAGTMESRTLIRQAIKRHYLLPATSAAS